MEKHSKCTSLEYKKDVSELCDLCPITEKINKGMADHSIRINERKKILTAIDFKKYAAEEKALFLKTMDDLESVESRYKEFRGKNEYIANWNLQYIWNKELIKLYDEILHAPKTKIKKLTNEVIALFCHLVNDSNHRPKGQDEIVGDYCKRICAEYGLEYVDNVRQAYPNKLEKNNKKKLEELLLPLVDAELREKINAIINPGKLYG